MDELVATCLDRMKPLVKDGKEGKFEITSDYLEEHSIRWTEFRNALVLRASNLGIEVNYVRIWDDWEIHFRKSWGRKGNFSVDQE